MALAVDITNGYDLSNEVLSKGQQSNAVFLFISQFNLLYFTNKMERLFVMWVSKLTKEDWPIYIVLQ